MAQKSWPWSTVAAVGDGAVSLSETISREFLAQYFGVQDPTLEGISKGVGGELAVSGTASPLAVAAGSGICYGLYINDAATTIAVSTPAVGTTGFRVVLQTNWGGVGGAGVEARTRIAVRKSADGVAAIPALVQTPSTTWEVSLATGTITTGGVIALTDARVFRKSTMVVATGGVNPDVVGDAELRNSAALSVIGRAANSAGDPADITGVDGQALRVASGVLGFGQVVAAGLAADSVITAKIQDGAVTAAKIANRTRSFFVPAILGQVTTTQLANANTNGIPIPDDANTPRVYGRFLVPADFVSTLVVTPVIVGPTNGSAGNLVLDSGAYNFADTEIYSSGSFDTGPTVVATPANNTVKVLTTLALAITTATLNEIVVLQFTRDGFNALDTFNSAEIYFQGWIVTYTADS